MVLEKKTVATPLQVIYLFGYPPTPYMDYSSKSYFTGFGCSGLSTFGAGGQGVFYPGTWVAV
jgi:hypothetical protein